MIGKFVARAALLGVLFAGASVQGRSAEIGGSFTADRNHAWGTMQGGVDSYAAGSTAGSGRSAQWSESGVMGNLSGFSMNAPLSSEMQSFSRGGGQSAGNASGAFSAQAGGNFSQNGSFDHFAAWGGLTAQGFGQ